MVPATAASQGAYPRTQHKHTKVEARIRQAAGTHSLARFKKMVVNSTEEICFVFTRAANSNTCVTAVAGSSRLQAMCS